VTGNPWVGDLTPAGARERARTYAARFDALAASGLDTHGEARLVHALVPAGCTVLDAGCGTGRVGARLAELGHPVIGVDVDAGMVDLARDRHPQLRWHQVDLADLAPDLDPLLAPGVGAVVAAGNVMPLLTPGAEDRAVRRMAAVLAPGGLLVAGFGLDDAHLPPSAPATAPFRDLATYDRACAAAGLEPAQRWAAWDRTPWDEGAYAVSVHRRVGPAV
jgi:SAM-dependent methyltransferase